MQKIFCPFIQDECIFECVFRDQHLDENDLDKCFLRVASMTMYSFGLDMITTKRTPSKDIDQILSILSNIEQNSSNDQTKSSNIENLLNDIKELLIKKS